MTTNLSITCDLTPTAVADRCRELTEMGPIGAECVDALRAMLTVASKMEGVSGIVNIVAAHARGRPSIKSVELKLGEVDKKDDGSLDRCRVRGELVKIFDRNRTGILPIMVSDFDVYASQAASACEGWIQCFATYQTDILDYTQHNPDLFRTPSRFPERFGLSCLQHEGYIFIGGDKVGLLPLGAHVFFG